MNVSANSKTSTPPAKSAKRRGMLAAGLLMTSAILLTGCADLAASVTVGQIGAELNEVLPTVVASDDKQTISENADFREVFFAIFPQFRP